MVWTRCLAISLALCVLGACLLVSPACDGRGGVVPPNRGPLTDLVLAVRAVAPRTRALLVGKRTKQAASCVTPLLRGSITDRVSIPPRPKMAFGGCATSLRLTSRRGRTPIEDFEISQNETRPFLVERLDRSEREQKALEDVTRLVRQLSESLSSSIDNGSDSSSMTRSEVPDGDDDVSQCLRELIDDLAAKRMADARHRVDNLAIHVERLTDLVRWLAFLDRNLLEALEFAARCRDQFVAADPYYRRQGYDTGSDFGRFPSGSALVHGEANYYEVERQAEGIFRVVEPCARGIEGVMLGEDPVALRHVLPTLWGAFRELRVGLPEAVRATLDDAASAPYARTRLTSVLFRGQSSGALPSMREALLALGRRRVRVGVHELFDVLTLRAGGYSCGFEWGDRFDPRIVAFAKGVGGDADAMFMSAYRLAHANYDPSRYVGGTHTLRSALGSKAFDCIRATDLLEAIYRQAGGTRSVEVRECRGGPSHTVAGHVQRRAGTWTVAVADALRPRHEGATSWPEGYATSEVAYAVEVYEPGLDTAIWSAGYVVTGPASGTRIDAALPFVPERSERREVRQYVRSPRYRGPQ
ncbi:MAG: hypothetical protein KDC95_06895 [Planctomycetes bacterium]|nr:hypothetical protein [Planctomycetota bacterium]